MTLEEKLDAAMPWIDEMAVLLNASAAKTDSSTNWQERTSQPVLEVEASGGTVIVLSLARRHREGTIVG